MPNPRTLLLFPGDRYDLERAQVEESEAYEIALRFARDMLDRRPRRKWNRDNLVPMQLNCEPKCKQPPGHVGECDV